ncbi:MAG: RluA family pseudouridine synthase [Deltaproteobacteria bacterium]|nr:RluA family pseudouridine synthase [Deltaproteobacteria bacterium]
MNRSTTFPITDAEAGLRLDQALAARIPGLSRRQARVLLDIGGVFVNGRRVKMAGRTVRLGERIEAHIGGALERATKEVGHAARARDAASLPQFGVVHEDNELIVVDKPAGLLTAPTPESDRNNLADLLMQRCGGSIFVVHRIDLQTSGLLVFAKTAAANRFLAEQFRTHSVDRAYFAIVAGEFPGDRHTLSLPLHNRRAVTHFEVVERFGDRATLLRCRLETGRTHQIRLHCLHLGHPVCGDPDHRMSISPRPPRMALHAVELGFIHPGNHERTVFNSALPPDLSAWLLQLRAAHRPEL